jgi:uncharacterized protein YbjT (DUF2867 family)
MASVILVTGPTGHVGYRLLERLGDAHVPATAMVRVDFKGDGLPRQVQHIVGSLDTPPPADLLSEFDRVFLVSPSSEEQVELEIYFIDALLTAGHRPHVVKVAADGFQDPDCQVRFMRNHRQVATHLDGTGLPVTYLAPNLYMESLLPTAGVIREKGLLPAPAGEGRIGFVASKDVAAVAAHALTAEGQEDVIYSITGPESLGYGDVADRISAVFARQVDYDDVPPEQARETMLADGMREWEAEGTLELFDWVRGGGCDVVTDAVRHTTDRTPHPIEDWLAELRGAFVGRPADVPPPQL